MLVGLTCAEEGDLVQRARGEPWLDHTPHSGERCWRVYDDELAHTTIILWRDGYCVSEAQRKRGRTFRGSSSERRGKSGAR